VRRAPVHDGLSHTGKSPATPPRTRWWTFSLGAVVGLALATAPTVAQPPGLDPEVARENALIVASLVRTTLVALHQANLTGNYTVLRDLAAPGFRDRNTAADLARIFAPIRDENIDLGAIVVLDPELARQPAIAENGMLHIEGTLRTRPTPVRFELLFQPVDDAWRLFGVSITPIRPVADAPPAEPDTDEAAVGGAAILPGSLVPPTPRRRPTTPVAE